MSKFGIIIQMNVPFFQHRQQVFQTINQELHLFKLLYRFVIGGNKELDHFIVDEYQFGFAKQLSGID
ncbi:hypothetical protein D3C81_1744070 [compost metagenome]